MLIQERVMKESPNTAAKRENGAEDALLKRVVDIIIHEFHGDVAAYFASLKRPSESQVEENEKESLIARKFARRF